MEQDKFWKITIVALLVIFFLLGLNAWFKIVPIGQTALSSTFTPVYCNQYEFSCCVQKQSTGNFQPKATTYFKCPDTAIDCLITTTTGTVGYGSKNCRIVQELFNLFVPIYKCDDEKYIYGVSDYKIPKGSIVWGSGNPTISYKIERQDLTFCGRSGCTQGVTIASDSCAMTVTQGTIFDKNKNNVGLSFTVPVGECVLSWQSGDRVICGNLEESCNLDSDCSGHTYGNKECYARNLQTYGCRQYGLPSGVTEINGELFGGNLLGTETKTYSGTKSRCEIISTQSVQCCGDTDCGSGSVCDTNTFTCKVPEQVSCSFDYQCGVSTQCDYTTSKLKTPDCISGKCGYSEKSVGCCFDANCPEGYYCNQEKNCQIKENQISTCPFQCCVGDSRYVNRPCTNGLFCNNFVCTQTPPDDGDTGLICESKFGGLVTGEVGYKEECGVACWFGITKPTKIQTCIYDYTMPIIIGVTLLLALGIYFTFGTKGKKQKGKKTNWVPLIILGGAGALVLLYFVIKTLLITILLILVVIIVLFVILNLATGGILGTLIKNIIRRK